MARARASRGGRLRDEIHARLMDLFRREGYPTRLTQSEIAERVGVKPPTVNDWFQRGAVPDGVTVARIVQEFSANAHFLLTGAGPEAPPGHGETEADHAFTLGARNVLAELSRIIEQLQVAYLGRRAISPDEAALAASRLVARTTGRPPQTGRQVRKR